MPNKSKHMKFSTNPKMIEKNGIYESIKYQENTVDDNETLHSLFLNTMEKFPNDNYLGTIKDNKLNYISRTKAYELMKSINSQLNKLVNEKDIICIFSPNRLEWFLTEHAIFMANCITCPLYSTLGVNAIKHILMQTESQLIYCAKENLPQLIHVIREIETSIRNIICFDSINLDNKELKLLKNKQIKIQEIDLKGIKSSKKENLCTLKSDDLATICYTSGTVGQPKGAMLSHKNFLSTIKQTTRKDNDFLEVSKDSVYISYLPLAHVMERLCTHAVTSAGGSLGIFRGDPKLLKDDIKLIKPTFIIGVPRVFNLFKEKIEAEIKKKNWLIRIIFKIGLNWKISNQRYGIYKNWFFDLLIFNKIKNIFGGKIIAGLSGSAPLNPDVSAFLQAVLSFRLTEGYGSTEATAANLLRTLNCHEPGNVGVPFAMNKIKLMKINEDDNNKKKGEIYIKGENVFKGYFKDEKRTSDTLIDGWLKTGDIGEVINDKFHIIGRDKDIFKTSLGEYIAPDKIEEIFKSSGICQDIFITGTKFCDFIVAIVIDTEKRFSTEEMNERIQKFGLEKHKLGELTKFEIPKKILILNEDFESMDLLTTTFKKKRHEIFERFENQIDSMYSN